MYSTLTCLTINDPQMYNLSTYLNNVLQVSLQKPFRFYNFSNLLRFAVNDKTST